MMGFFLIQSRQIEAIRKKGPKTTMPAGIDFGTIQMIILCSSDGDFVRTKIQNHAFA
jgi:hypothetical protein